MNLKTKKIVAREFLLLLLCIAMGLCTFLGVYLYNSYNANKVEELEREIKTIRIIADSLQKSISIDYDEFGIPIRKLDSKERAKLDKNIIQMKMLLSMHQILNKNF